VMISAGFDAHKNDPCCGGTHGDGFRVRPSPSRVCVYVPFSNMTDFVLSDYAARRGRLCVDDGTAERGRRSRSRSMKRS
jgi:hypothetical protein